MPYDTTILGWMTEYELSVLESLGKKLQPNSTIVEVGSMFGRSTICWAKTCPSSTVYAIDIFYDEYVNDHSFSEKVCEANSYPLSGVKYPLYDMFKKNVEPYSNIVPIRGISPEQVQFTKNIDLFFLDAAHSNPSDWNNLQYFVPLINSGGIVCGHDYDSFFPDVIDNVRRLEKLLSRPATVYDGTSIWSIEVP